MADPERRRLDVNGIELTYLSAGPDDGTLAVCVHGFPDTPAGFVPLLLALAEAGYHAVAPWMRGYAPSAVPADGTSALPAWVADLNAIHEAVDGDGSAVLIGHDWGALATYGTASVAPDRWRRIVTGAVPPPMAMLSVLGTYDQIKKFWYQYLFMRPGAEDIVAADDLAFLDHLWADWSPGLDVASVIGPAKDALRERANLTAALSTYRLMYGAQELSVAESTRLAAELAGLFTPHSQPTLYLQGADDGCVSRLGFEATPSVLPEGSDAVLLEGAGHFFQYEVPERFTELVLEFLAR